MIFLTQTPWITWYNSYCVRKTNDAPRAQSLYAKRYREEGTNLVLIEPDLHELFPDSDAVNRALRDYVEKHKEPAP